MPLPKGHFNRFNIAEYMAKKRLDHKVIEAKTKQARAMAVKLKRLDEKVKRNFLLVENIFMIKSH